jgi:hypothetical protein
MREHRSFTLCALVVVFAFALAGCAEASLSQQEPARIPSATAIAVQGGSLRVVNAKLQRSYQTHYIMTYPPDDMVFLQVAVELQGIDQAEGWLQDSLTLRQTNTRISPVHVRRRLVGSGYVYGVDHDFAFVYELFYPIEPDFDPAATVLWLPSGPVATVGGLLPSNTDRIVLSTLTPIAGDVLSGEDNEALGPLALISGGSGNRTDATHSTIAGGQLNLASAAHSTVAGGRENRATSFFSSIGGGFANTADGREATVGGGSRNSALGTSATVAGGIRNGAVAANSLVGGGSNNLASGVYAGIAAGVRNAAAGYAAYVGGGAGNDAGGDQAAVAGGLNNQASGPYSAVGGGLENRASGRYAVVSGGSNNLAQADFSMAAGRSAQIAQDHVGSFLFADSTDSSFRSEAANEFAVRATGGVRMVSAVDASGRPLAGAMLAPGSGSWSMLSDQAAKADFRSIDPDQILQQLVQLPLFSWRYRTQSSAVRHIGPTAQDFADAFGMGEDHQHISAVDADGVALAAIQALAIQVNSQRDRLEEQERQLTQLESKVDALTTDQHKSDVGQAVWLLLAAATGSLTTLAWIRQNDKRAASQDSAI